MYDKYKLLLLAIFICLLSLTVAPKSNKRRGEKGERKSLAIDNTNVPKLTPSSLTLAIVGGNKKTETKANEAGKENYVDQTRMQSEDTTERAAKLHPTTDIDWETILKSGSEENVEAGENPAVEVKEPEQSSVKKVLRGGQPFKGTDNRASVTHKMEKQVISRKSDTPEPSRQQGANKRQKNERRYKHTARGRKSKL